MEQHSPFDNPEEEMEMTAMEAIERWSANSTVTFERPRWTHNEDERIELARVKLAKANFICIKDSADFADELHNWRHWIGADYRVIRKLYFGEDMIGGAFVLVLAHIDSVPADMRILAGSALTDRHPVDWKILRRDKPIDPDELGWVAAIDDSENRKRSCR
jgi:hypothetical protein